MAAKTKAQWFISIVDFGGSRSRGKGVHEYTFDWTPDCVVLCCELDDSQHCALLAETDEWQPARHFVRVQEPLACDHPVRFAAGVP